ncbi:hypothetical protein Tco_1415390 [Tanacetum coccineum]
MDEQSRYKQDKTITRQSINVKRHIFNVIGGTEEFEERDLNIGGDYNATKGEDSKCGRPVAESRGRGTGGRVGRGGGRGRRPRGGNDERIDELNGQGNDQGMGANGGVKGVNGNVEGVNGGAGGAPDFSTIIAQ